MDVLSVSYNALIANPFIQEQANGRIKFYEYPESSSIDDPFIIIDPLDVPKPSDFADNTWLTYDCFYQIEVWTKNRTKTLNLAKEVHQVMWNKGFSQNSGIDEYDSDSGIFRDARRYNGKLYREDFDTISESFSIDKKE